MVLSYCQISTAGSACPGKGRSARLVNAYDVRTMTERDYAWRVLLVSGMVLFILSAGLQPWLHTLSIFMIALGIFGAIEHFLRHVWPTPYKLAKDHDHLLRVHRITHAVEILTPTGWRLITGPDSGSEHQQMS